MYNPKELSIDKSVPWQRADDSTEDSPALEYLGPEPKTATVDLLFEDKLDVRKPLLLLEGLAREDEKLKRPPRVKIVWGTLPEPLAGRPAPPGQGRPRSCGTWTVVLPAAALPDASVQRTPIV